MNDKDAGENLLAGLSFAPDWAKTSADKQDFEALARKTESDDNTERGRGRGRRDRRDTGVRWEDRGGARMPQRPRTAFQPSANLHGDVRPHRPAGERDSEHRQHTAPYARRGGEPGRFGRGAEHIQPDDLQVDVRFLPDPKELSVVIGKISKGHRAFPIVDLARLFLQNPDSCEVRIERKPDARDLKFYQCTRCGWAATTEPELREHISTAHFDEEFESETIEGEQPTGSFVCVARCGVTGALLAPPNHHSFNQRVTEMLRGECRHMSEAEYRAKIETVHDAELVEQWREASRVRTVYRRKDAAEAADVNAAEAAKAADVNAAEATEAADVNAAEAAETADAKPREASDEATADAPAPSKPPMLERAEAESIFANEIVPSLISRPKNISCKHAVALALNDAVLAPAVRHAWQRELRYPASLFFALRGALRHRRLYVFKAGEGRGLDFVMARTPIVLDVEHAVPELKAIIDHITTNPATTRGELLLTLGIPPEGPQTPEHEQLLQQLKWVTERGHVIEYHNGVLALPEARPVFRYLEN